MKNHKKLLVIALVLAITMAGLGVGFAMWSETLTIDGTVGTGKVDAVFSTAECNDEGNDPVVAISTILKAADHLAANQNVDGGFAWILTDPAGSSTTNTLGITAMAILEAHELQDKASYETALAKAYKYANDNPPTYTWDGSKYNETTSGVDSNPDITFLIGLAQAAASDASLLTAIRTEMGDNTIVPGDIADLAQDRWDDRVLYIGATATPPNGTATTYAERIRDDRYAAGYYDLIPWDNEAGVKAALALHGYYPGQGYDQQAKDIAEVIYDAMYGTTVYFDPTVSNQDGYILGLTGAIEAFTEAGVHADKATELKVTLTGEQHADGWWYFYVKDDTDIEKSVQNTAYAVMALRAQGDADGRASAIKGAGWLVSAQKADGGWYAEAGTGDECLEVDSEAAWALVFPQSVISDKDVATQTVSGTGTKTLIITITNGYPCYCPTIDFTIDNIGTIPVKVESIKLVKISKGIYEKTVDVDLVACQPKYVDFEGGTVDDRLDPTKHDFALHLSKLAVGQQIEPYGQTGDAIPGDLTIHVEQAAEEEIASYDFTIEIVVAQWNEVP